jgi:hypothetical protein
MQASQSARQYAELEPDSPQHNGRQQYDVFISHAGQQKDFALWIRSNVRCCGYQAFVDERDLRYCPLQTSSRHLAAVQFPALP